MVKLEVVCKLIVQPFPIYNMSAADDLENFLEWKYGKISLNENASAVKHCGKWTNCSTAESVKICIQVEKG